MKFIIGTLSSSFEFIEDYKLIKSSLLYADDVELIGMAEYAIFKYLPYCINRAKDIDALIEKFVPFLKIANTENTNNTMEQLNELKKKLYVQKMNLSKNKYRRKEE